MKKNIYIELNNVIRDINSKTVEVYKSDNPDKEFEGDYDGEDLQKYLGIESTDELIDFMYVECPMRIFGYSSETERGISFMINEFYKKYRDSHKVTIFSNEIEKSKPATLMFLARMGILVDNVKFFPLNDFDAVNEQADIIITNNKKIINSKKTNYITTNKKESKNKNVTQVTSFKELVEDEYIERNEFT